MSSSGNNDQNPRKTPVMEDSPSKKIEFLRAQLFSERSVSQTARQRVDELSKRVAELEAQLKVVSLQRKKAEKATVTVLAILENLGKSDVSEGFDSGSEQGDALCESNVSDNKDAHNEMFDGDACSSSEIGSSALCRWIRQGQTRSAAEESCNDSSVIPAFDNAVASFRTESPQGCLEHQNEKGQVGTPALQVSKNQSHMDDSNLFCKLEGDKDLESALQHQAQLIGRYGAEERAQREWEEKYGEGTSFMRDTGENRSDVTEERDEIKATEKTCSLPRAITMKSPNGFQSPALAEETSGFDSPSEFTFPKGNHEPLHFSSLPVNPSSSLGGSSLRKGEDSREGYELALKPHTTDQNVRPVLHALEQVKLSLKQKLNISPQIESRLPIKAVAPSTHSSSTSRFNLLNPHRSSAIPFSSNYTIPTYPFSPNLIPRLPSPEGFSATFPSRETGMPPPTRFSPYNEYIRPNMRR